MEREKNNPKHKRGKVSKGGPSKKKAHQVVAEPAGAVASAVDEVPAVVDLPKKKKTKNPKKPKQANVPQKAEGEAVASGSDFQRRGTGPLNICVKVQNPKAKAKKLTKVSTKKPQRRQKVLNKFNNLIKALQQINLDDMSDKEEEDKNN